MHKRVDNLQYCVVISKLPKMSLCVVQVQDTIRLGPDRKKAHSLYVMIVDKLIIESN